MGKNKRKRGGGDAFQDAYQGVTTTPRESTGRPGTPHAFFKDSYDVQVQKQITNETAADKSTCCSGTVVVHQHANGLCIVTVGDQLLSKDVKDVKLMVQEAPQGMSANERRKRQSKLLRGGTIADQQGLTSPNTVLAQVTLENGVSLQIPAGVWGTVLELKTNLTPRLLQEDPLLDGYLAVILPTGSFPPRFRTAHEQDADQQKEATNKQAAIAQDE